MNPIKLMRRKSVEKLQATFSTVDSGVLGTEPFTSDNLSRMADKVIVQTVPGSKHAVIRRVSSDLPMVFQDFPTYCQNVPRRLFYLFCRLCAKTVQIKMKFEQESDRVYKFELEAPAPTDANVALALDSYEEQGGKRVFKTNVAHPFFDETIA